MQTFTTTAIYDAKRKVLIPQELPRYRQFTVRVVFIPQEYSAQESVDGLTKAIKEVEDRKVIGPFHTTRELKQSLEA